MKLILLLIIVLTVSVPCQSRAAIYSIYATEPSGILLSPNKNSMPNTVTIKSGQRIQLTGYYDQEDVKWYGEGLPANGSPFYDTFVAPVNTSKENLTVTYKANNSNTYAIIVTVLPQPGVIDPLISANTYCVTNPLLTATGCAGIAKWYKIQGNGTWQPYTRVLIPGSEGNTYQISESGNYCATCTVAGEESYGSETISSSGVQPYVSVGSSQSNTGICMWSERTVQASGLGIEAGTLTWFEKIGTDPATDIGSGTSKIVEITNLNTSYYAQLSVPGCPSKTSNTFTFTVQQPTALSSDAVRNFKAHAQSLNILADDNCQIIAGFIPNNNNDGVNVMLGKMMTAKVLHDNSVKLYNNQPYLQRHFDFEPDDITEAQNAWYTVKMYFTQADFDAFNAASTVKLPANSSPEELSKLSNLRIWQTHGTPTEQPATPGNYSDGPVTGYACIPCISSSWNTANNWWEVSLNTSGFSGFFITAEGASPLPVTLLHFSAKKQENTITLNWQTTEETNSEYFEVQHSTNGKQWSPIGKVASAGESKTLQHYTYSHSNPILGENLYRMKMVDRDATFAMSRIVSVAMERAGSLSVFPNPATVTVIATSTTPIRSYQLLTTNGRIVSESPKVGTMRLELSDLPVTPGLYMLKITMDNGKTEHRKLVIK